MYLNDLMEFYCRLAELHQSQIRRKEVFSSLCIFRKCATRCKLLSSNISVIVLTPQSITESLGKDLVDARKKHSFDNSYPGKCMVRSMYFSKKKVCENPTKEPDAEQLMSTSGTYTSIQSSKLVGNNNLDVNVELFEDLGKHSTPRIDAALNVCFIS